MNPLGDDMRLRRGSVDVKLERLINIGSRLERCERPEQLLEFNDLIATQKIFLQPEPFRNLMPHKW